MPALQPVTLSGQLVTLEPLSAAHHDELVEAVQDGRLWELWYTSVPAPEAMAADIAARLAQQAAGTMLPAQRTGINAESKLLLLTHAFDVLGCLAVEFRTHWHNQQSRGAVARLGAKQDGVLRNHRRMPDGSLRDTVVFSIVDSEWPAVRAGLQHRLVRREIRA